MDYQQNAVAVKKLLSALPQVPNGYNWRITRPYQVWIPRPPPSSSKHCIVEVRNDDVVLSLEDRGNYYDIWLRALSPTTIAVVGELARCNSTSTNVSSDRGMIRKTRMMRMYSGISPYEQPPHGGAMTQLRALCAYYNLTLVDPISPVAVFDGCTDMRAIIVGNSRSTHKCHGLLIANHIIESSLVCTDYNLWAARFHSHLNSHPPTEPLFSVPLETLPTIKNDPRVSSNLAKGLTALLIVKHNPALDQLARNTVLGLYRFTDRVTFMDWTIYTREELITLSEAPHPMPWLQSGDPTLNALTPILDGMFSGKKSRPRFI